MKMNDIKALFWLTATLIRRLLRYGMILRSLSFPAALISLTLVLTVGVISATRPPARLVVTPSLYTKDLAKELQTHDIELISDSEPETWVRNGAATAGSNGVQFWVSGVTKTSLTSEAILRTALGSSWRPTTPSLPKPERIHQLGALIVRLLLGIFSLYGVVFGTAMVARDREDGSLEIDCTLPVRRWVHGAARCLAASTLLVVFLILSTWMMQAIIGVSGATNLILHGVSASLASVSLGIVSAGRAKINSGFGSALALGLTITTACFGIGYALPSIGKFLPLASVVTGGPVAVPLATSTLLALSCVTWFTRYGLESQ